MNFSQSLQYLKDRIIAVEKELKDSHTQLKEEVQKNFKILAGLLLLEAIPTLQALGIPTKDIIPNAVKLLLGFLHI